MLPADMENYLSEVRRVMHPDGRCLITYFLLNEVSVRLMSGENSFIDFQYSYGPYRQHEPGPGGSIAYDEAHIVDLYRTHRLKIIGQIHYGYWCGRDSGRSSQDIIVAMKQESV